MAQAVAKTHVQKNTVRADVPCESLTHCIGLYREKSKAHAQQQLKPLIYRHLKDIPPA